MTKRRRSPSWADVQSERRPSPPTFAAFGRRRRSLRSAAVALALYDARALARARSRQIRAATLVFFAAAVATAAAAAIVAVTAILSAMIA